MRKRLSLVLVTALTMGSAVVLQAGEPVPQTKLEQLQAIVSAGADEYSAPLQATAQFLQLRSDQVQTLVGLLQARSAALMPAVQQLDQKGKQLDKLLESGGAAADVGQLAIQIRALQKQVMQGQQDFLSHWRNSLEPEQGQRLDAIHVAAQLQPILPAFAQLALF